MSGNCIGERTGAKLSCKLAYSREGIPKSPFMPTVVVILERARQQGKALGPPQKVGPGQLAAMRRMREGGASLRRIANDFECSPSTVLRALQREEWHNEWSMEDTERYLELSGGCHDWVKRL